MKLRKIPALILSLTMLSSFLPQTALADNTEDKERRQVYLYAQSESETQQLPLETAKDKSTIYKNETANIFLAIDKPNKGERAEDGTHKEPMYDLNGYTAKITFDSEYFELDTDTLGKNSALGANPVFDYTYPNVPYNGTVNGNDNEHIDTGTGDEPSSGEVGFMAFDEKQEKSGNRTSVSATVFVAGTYYPDGEEGNWYTLLKLPLKPKQEGYTEVSVELVGNDRLTLFAKDNSGDAVSKRRTFNIDAKNNGVHKLNIVNRDKPDPPVANPSEGRYTQAELKDGVKLYCPHLAGTDGENTVCDKCVIKYTTEKGKSNNREQYTTYTSGESIKFSDTTTIWCYTQVKAEPQKQSNIAEFPYHIIPDAPYLFYAPQEDSKKIPNTYSEYNTFTVYVSDTDTFGSFKDTNEVFYTFAHIDETAELSGENTDPEASWVKLEGGGGIKQSIEITKNRTLRLIVRAKGTEENTEISDMREYYLGIKPAEVTASPESAEYPNINKDKVDVELSTETRDAVIYYTTDGSNPITNGLLYEADKPITLTADTVIRAVAYRDGIYSEVTAFNYIFDYNTDDRITAFHPSGVYEGEVDVTLTADSPENKIKYQINGGEWITTEDAASAPIKIDKDTIIKAVAVKPDGTEGAEYTFTYKIKPLPPMFSTASAQFTTATEISVYCSESTAENTDRYDLYYTTDGSSPITSNTRKQADAQADLANIKIDKYTVVKAAVLKDGVSWSDIVTNSYDIVTMKPVKPITTLPEGHYTQNIGADKGYKTGFIPQIGDVKIYYTIGKAGEFVPDPVPNTAGTTEYKAGNEFDIKGAKTVKAIAVNVFGVKSDVAVFEYVIAPEAPTAPPSAKINADSLPEIPINAVKGSKLSYRTDNGEWTTIDYTEGFTLDLSKYGENSVQLEIKSTLDGVESHTNKYFYELTDDETVLATPFADKQSGMYEDRVLDKDNQYALEITLDTLGSGDIQYRLYEDSYELDGLNWKNTGEWKNNGEWIDYTEAIAIKNDAVIQARTTDGTNTSEVVSYVYKLKPLAPIIKPDSGRYADNDEALKNVIIRYDELAPQDKKENPKEFADNQYKIWYRLNGEKTDNIFDVDKGSLNVGYTLSLKAYVKDNATGRVSENVINYYILESGSIAKGSIYLDNPYYQKKRISTHLLSQSSPDNYAGGIKLRSTNNSADKHYSYKYKLRGSERVYETNNMIYSDASPIMVNEQFEWIEITAQLKDENGTPISDIETYHIDFVDLEVPVPTPYSENKTEYSKGTKVSLVFSENYTEVKNGELVQKPEYILYYTTDGSDPVKNGIKYTYEDSKNGKEVVSVDGAKTIKAVYYNACGNNGIDCPACWSKRYEDCPYGVFGRVGAYHYNTQTVITTGGGSGGGGGTHTVDKTRKYTKDIFGNEHPTHIGYINGYPDGSVQPDGNITREEMTSILYRIKNKEYEAPFVPTGDVFPDVNSGRWSLNDIEYMADKKVVEGYPDGEFKPERNLTRAEFSALIRRFTGLTKPADKNIFPDLEESHWAYKDILILTEAGLLQGYEDGTIRPERPISRAEVMTVVNKILGRCPDDAYVKGLNFNPYNDLDKNAWHYVTVLEATITHDYYLNDKASLEIKWENWK